MKLTSKRNRKNKIEMPTNTDSEYESVTSGSEFVPSDDALSNAETESNLSDSELQSLPQSTHTRKHGKKRKISETDSESDTPFDVDAAKAPTKKKACSATHTNRNVDPSVPSTAEDTNLSNKKTTSKPVPVPSDESSDFESDTSADTNDTKANKQQSAFPLSTAESNGIRKSDKKRKISVTDSESDTSFDVDTAKAPAKKKDCSATDTNSRVLESENESRVNGLSPSFDPSVPSTSDDTNLPNKKAKISKPKSVPSDESSDSESDTSANAITNKAKKQQKKAAAKEKSESATPNNSLISDLDISINMESTGKVLKEKKNKRVKSSDSGTKLYCCLYCLKERKRLKIPDMKVHYAKLVDHYESAHANEKEIIDLKKIPKIKQVKGKPKCAEQLKRQKILDDLRTEASFLNNTKTNKVKEFFVSRRPQAGSKNTVGHYGVCLKCKKSLSKSSLRKHVRKCTKTSFKRKHVIQSSSRATLGDYHEVASENSILIISKIRQCDLLEEIRYDKAIMLWLNAEASKNETTPHHHIKIRANLRRLGRLKIEMMKMDEIIHEFFHIFNETLYDKFIEACKILGKQDPISKTLNSASTANDMSFLIKNVANIYDVRLGQGHDAERAQISAFIKKVNTLWHSSIGNTIAETQAQNKRNKSVVLPTEDDMSCLKQYLENEMATSYKSLRDVYNPDTYTRLRNSLVSYLHLTNCRRAGEIERLSTQEFDSAQLHEDDYRIQVRGKRTKPVPIVFKTLINEYLMLLIYNRNRAQIHPQNPYVFSNFPDVSHEFTFVRACTLMEKFSNECGAKKPETLRGTLFRKQVATKGMDDGIGGQEVEHLAGFLGHTTRIHMQNYRQSLMHRDIEMSNFVRKAQTPKNSQLAMKQPILDKEIESNDMDADKSLADFEGNNEDPANESLEDSKENNGDSANNSFTDSSSNWITIESFQTNLNIHLQTKGRSKILTTELHQTWKHISVLSKKV